MTMTLDVFQTTTAAMIVFFIGYALVGRSGWLRGYGIPEPMVGGAVAAVAIALLHWLAGFTILFDLERRDVLLVYFFAALGLRAEFAALRSAGRPLAILVALAAAFIVVQNAAGVLLAEAFGHAPQVGIVAGSMALIGRSGTTIAWAPVLEAQFELQHLSRLGTGVNMLGLFAACAVGGPIARWLIRRHRLATPGAGGDLDVGLSRDTGAPGLDAFAFLLALLTIHVAIILGDGLGWAFRRLGLGVPLYVTALVAGIALRQLLPRLLPGGELEPADRCMTLIAYVSLGLFYTMTLMSLKLWTAGTYLGFVAAVIVVQVVLAVLYIVVVVFPAMGRDYPAAVVSAGFAGISLGSTATTMAIMTAVARDHGPARQAFIIVPVACGVFIDIINSVAITLFTALW